MQLFLLVYNQKMGTRINEIKHLKRSYLEGNFVGRCVEDASSAKCTLLLGNRTPFVTD